MPVFYRRPDPADTAAARLRLARLGRQPTLPVPDPALDAFPDAADVDPASPALAAVGVPAPA
ncbi:MAG: hypothetical protein WCB04_11460, partial [Mycobacteriales bacterium]